MKRWIVWPRLMAIMVKEFIQMRRDSTTFAMILAIPLLQLILFGYAINTNPKYLPSAIVIADHSEFTRTFVTALENTHYFRFANTVKTKEEANRLIETGKVQFILTIPSNFTRDFIRGEKPQLLLEADATDPVATGNAIQAAQQLSQTVWGNLLTGSLAYLQVEPSPVKMVTHLRYNPEIKSQYNIVPGLIGVVLTMTMVVITAQVMTRERERGTMESLLATPVKPIEVMIGKVTPYIIVGYIQMLLILLAAYYLFSVPMEGSLIVLVIITLPFLLANLMVGLMFSTLAGNQLQAMQMAFFFFLPSILLSGFMFPFYGMPQWAQWIGEVLPLTHFLRMVRGILLKGNDIVEVSAHLWPIILFFFATLFLGLKRYRRTLD